MNNDIVKFDLSSRQIKFREILNKEFVEIEMFAISDIDPNRNKSHFTLDSMKKAIGFMKNKPIVGSFLKGDFGSHDGRLDFDAENKKVFWNTENGERILGWIRESDTVEIVQVDGLNWIRFTCVLCVKYCYNQVKRLLKDKNKHVSVEVTINNSYAREDGIEEIQDFTLNGVTILGSKVKEAIPDAHCTVLDYDSELFAEQKKVLCFAYENFDNEISSFASCNKNSGREEEQNEQECYNIYSIKLDKTKEAMSEKSWGDVDKTALRNKVVGASNFKSIADDIFLDLREGWEDGETSKLKYPVMEIKQNNIAVYNRGGLASARAYAEKNNEQSILTKIDKIYNKLGLNKDEMSQYSISCDEQYSDMENIEKLEEIIETAEEKKDEVLEEMKEVVEEIKEEAASDEHFATEEEPKTEECAEGCPCEGEKEETKAEEKCSCEQMAAEIESLKMSINSLQEENCALKQENESLKDKQQMFADYEELKARCEAAEKKVWEHFCDGLKSYAIAKMANENIKEEDSEKIICKCSSGEYKCESEIDKDIAYAIYVARPMPTAKFSAPISMVGGEIENTTPKTRAERIAMRAGKLK